MKNPTVTTLLVASAFAAITPGFAQENKEASAKTTAYQTSVSQEQLRATTRRLKGEMIGLLDEFGQYQAAGGELTKLKTALGELDTVTEQDMAAVVRILREASRMEKVDDTKAKLVEASGEQKEIQSMLRAIADRLILQKDEASIQQRLENLALRQMANLRDTKAMAESGSKPDKVKSEQQKTQQVNKAEQEALKEEIRLAMDTLENLAKKSDSPAKEAFEKALKTGQENMIRTQADQSSEQLKTDFNEAAKSQEELLKNLQKMAEGLNSRKTAEEQSRELASKMDELARKQEQLAKAVTKAWGDQQKQEVRKEQEKISDQLEMAKEALAKLNPEAAKQAEQAQQQSNDVAKQMQDRKEMEKVDAVAKASDAQNAVADKLDAVSEMLEKQADALAGNEGQQNQGEQETSQMDQQQAAISDAVSQVMDAKSQMALAKKQLQSGDQQDARQRLDRAQQKIDSAKQEISKAGEAVSKSVGEELSKADENIGKAEQGIGVGSKQDQEKSRWNLDRAEDNAARALAGLQQAANQLAAQQASQQSKQQQASQQPGQQPPGQPQSSKSDTSGPASGQMGKDKNEGTDISAVSKAKGGQREALSLLQQEKAPTEYEAMVQQYIRNLAEAATQE